MRQIEVICPLRLAANLDQLRHRVIKVSLEEFCPLQLSQRMPQKKTKLRTQTALKRQMTICHFKIRHFESYLFIYLIIHFFDHKF